MSHPVYRHLRAPQEDGTAIVDPPLADIQAIVERNRQLASARRYDCQGKPLDLLSIVGRGELLDRAAQYTAAYRDTKLVAPRMPSTPLLLAGHQPELFHPGVWFKNFLLSAVGQRLNATAVNLIVDTDVVKNTSLRVPTKNSQSAAIENISFDAPGDAVPFEERRIQDRWLFDSFEQRVMASYSTCCISGNEPYELLIYPLWRWALAYANEGHSQSRLGEIIAQARHRLEWKFGLETLEVPLSSLAQTSQFRWFSVHLMAQLPWLLRVYNKALAEYRTVNGIRSHAHPVPRLEHDDEWLEAPFLVWTKQDPRRRHLFVRQNGESLQLSDRAALRLTIDVSPEVSAEKAVEQLSAAESRGVKIRPRALITTMYSRLVLSDLFIHGIGGAKYDELTDLIIERFFGIEPPAYVTATATFRLPIDRPQVTVDDVQQVARRIRELRYRPEAFLRDSRVNQDSALKQSLAPLAAEKREFLSKHDLRRCAQEVFDQLDRLNRAMHDLLRPVERELRAEHAQLVEQLKQSQLLGSREFSFVLFPSEILPARLLDLSRASS